MGRLGTSNGYLPRPSNKWRGWVAAWAECACDGIVSMDGGGTAVIAREAPRRPEAGLSVDGAAGHKIRALSADSDSTT